MKKIAVFLLTILILVNGCFPISLPLLSIYPIYDADTIANSKMLEGVWVSFQGSIQLIDFKVETENKGRYKVDWKQIDQKGETRFIYEGYVVEINGEYFLDLYPYEIDEKWPSLAALPVHLIFRVTRPSEETLGIWVADYDGDWIRYIKQGEEFKGKFVYPKDADIIFTTYTEEMIEILKKMGEGLAIKSIKA